MIGAMFSSWMFWLTRAKTQSHMTKGSVLDELAFFLSTPPADSPLLPLSLCRSSSTSGESWWMRSRQPRTLGSARLWAPWRALLPLPPAPRPRPHPLQRRALPRRPSLHLYVPCRMHTRAEEHKLKKQAAEKCSIPFFSAGGKAEVTSFLDCK